MFNFCNRKYYKVNNHSHFRFVCRRVKGRQLLKKNQGLVCKRNKNTWKIYLSFNCIFLLLKNLMNLRQSVNRNLVQNPSLILGSACKCYWGWAKHTSINKMTGFSRTGCTLTVVSAADLVNSKKKKKNEKEKKKKTRKEK